MDDQSPRSLFKTITYGWAAGAGLIYLPVMLGVAIGADQPGFSVALLVMVALLPVVLLMQGAILAWVIQLGWWFIGKVRRPKP